MMVPDPGNSAVAVKVIDPPAMANCVVSGLRVTVAAITFTVVGDEVALTPPPPSCTRQEMVYVPMVENVATVLELLPPLPGLLVKLTAAGPVELQVYVKLPFPPGQLGLLLFLLAVKFKVPPTTTVWVVDGLSVTVGCAKAGK